MHWKNIFQAKYNLDSREGLNPHTGSDYEFHKDIMDDDWGEVFWTKARRRPYRISLI